MPAETAAPPSPAVSLVETPLLFEANEGQAPARFTHIANGDGLRALLAPSEVVIALDDAETGKTRAATLELVGGADDAPMRSGVRAPTRVNYLIGDEPSRWRTNVPTYERVVYDDVYPGIDVAYYGNRRNLEYDFVVAPGADPAAIELHFAGSKGVRIADDGDLVVSTGDLVVSRPVAYQDTGGNRRAVDAAYALVDERVRIRLGSYDRDRPLVIDPVLSYLTSFGGNAFDTLGAIAVDGSGSAYVAGRTNSREFATPGALQTVKAFKDMDAYIAKLSPAGDALVYLTYLGGDDGGADNEGFDTASGIAVDESGHAYVAGATTSGDFPTLNGFQNEAPSSRAAFVTKLAPDGASLVWSTYLGPATGADSIALGDAGTVSVTGETSSPDFPLVDPVQATIGGRSDVFVATLAPSGSALTFSTYLGGTDFELRPKVAVTGNAVYVAGTTWSTDFPTTPDAFKAAVGTGAPDAFAARVEPGSVSYATYLGGRLSEEVGDIAVDESGAAYVAGTTRSNDFPTTPGAHDTVCNATHCDAWSAEEGFVTKLAPDGRSLAYSTFLGGAGGERLAGIAVDDAGRAHVSGTGDVAFPPRTGFLQARDGSAFDVLLARLDPSGSMLEVSTDFGGAVDERAGELALDDTGSIYVIGTTDSWHLPFTSGAYDRVGCDSSPCWEGFVAKVDPDGDAQLEENPPIVNIRSPEAGDRVGGFITVTADVSDDTRVDYVEFTGGGRLLPLRDYTPPYAVTWDTTNVDWPSATISAWAYDPSFNRGSDHVVVELANPPPANDDFEDARLLEGPVGRVIQSTLRATGEPGEPPHAGWGASESVWYSWTAPSSGPVVFESRDDWVLLAVYRGTALESLVEVGSVAASNVTNARLTFDAIAGETYRIAVDGRWTAGRLTLMWGPPANDDFDDAREITGSSATVYGTNVAASQEKGEPRQYIPGRGTTSVWYRWTAPSSGRVILSTRGSELDTVVAVFEGDALGALTHVASDDDSGGSLASLVAFDANAGTTYRIVVSDSLGGTGRFLLSLNPPPDAEHPAVDLTAPIAGTTVGGRVEIAAGVSDDVAVARVEFLVEERVVDVDATAPYGTTWDARDLPDDGSVAFSARAFDTAGRSSATSPVTVRLDSFAPETTIVDAPPEHTTSREARFSIEASEDDVTFECALDGAEWAACSATPAFSDLADGPHSLAVRATDAAGRTDATPAEASWTVDNAPPQTTIPSRPPEYHPSTSAEFEFASDEEGASFECRLDGNVWIACPVSRTFDRLTQGEHVLAVRATDRAGNVDPSPAEATWIVDTVPPETVIASRPPEHDDSPDASFTFALNEDAVSFACALDGGDWTSCSAMPVFPGLADGWHALAVRAMDRAGNTDPSPAHANWLVDTVPPDTTIFDRPPLHNNSPDAKFAFRSNEGGVSFECALDEGDWTGCSATPIFAALSDGPHAIAVRAIDRAGNTDPAPDEATWTVDTVPPETIIFNRPPAHHNSPDAAFALGSFERASFECALDAAEWTPCPEPTVFRGLADGPHSLRARATDRAGNTDSTPDEAAWTVDTVAPRVSMRPMRLVPGAQLTRGVPVELSWSGSDETGIVEYELGQQRGQTPFRPVARVDADTTALVRRLHPRSWYDFHVRAFDAAGNVSPWEGGFSFSPRTQQEASEWLRFSGPWTRRRVANASGGRLAFASKRGARVRLVFSGKSVGWVAARGRGKGKAAVFIGGRRAAVVDLYSRQPRAREFVFTRTWPSSDRRVVEIRVLHTRNRAARGFRVDLDALVVLR